jgi:hypothetical protein
VKKEQRPDGPVPVLAEVYWYNEDLMELRREITFDKILI